MTIRDFSESDVPVCESSAGPSPPVRSAQRPAEAPAGARSAVPRGWEQLWGAPSSESRHEVEAIRDRSRVLAENVPLEDRSGQFEALVGPHENHLAPVHRWFSFKEAFSYRLPREVLSELGAGESRRVADVFGGVATTALSLQTLPAVKEVISIEYSPLAQFVGDAKLNWHALDPGRLRRLAEELASFDARRSVCLPELAAFHNPEIYPRSTARALVAARNAIDLSSAQPIERDFFLVGLAAVAEDLSGAMKDGRALRITRGRRRRPTSLIGVAPNGAGASPVRYALRRQWNAMIDDLVLLASEEHDIGTAVHIRGDARELDQVQANGAPVLPQGSIGLLVYSPPYLNCIDYSEIYKLELWLLEFITLQDEFRGLRLGTLRSHPSVDFPERRYLDTCADRELVDLIRGISHFVVKNGARPGVGRAIFGYFDDMYRVLEEQLRVLEPGGHACCVVGNSTFSRRHSETKRETWRLPVLTDVLLAALASSIGFEQVRVWEARELRPRNVRAGQARESIVVMRKPPV